MSAWHQSAEARTDRIPPPSARRPDSAQSRGSGPPTVPATPSAAHLQYLLANALRHHQPSGESGSSSYSGAKGSLASPGGNGGVFSPGGFATTANGGSNKEKSSTNTSAMTYSNSGHNGGATTPSVLNDTMNSSVNHGLSGGGV